MFVAEALITAGLIHPNIVPLHDMGIDEEGRLFYSMKLVSGKTWQDLIPVQSLETNLDILLKVSDAVAYAHSRGVINRDLKPENVIVGNFGEVIVLDWGVAVAKPQFALPNNEIKFPRNACIPDVGPAGTPPYMAPELLEDDTNRVSPASDVYLLGAMLYEILEGYPPHIPQQWREAANSNEKRNVLLQAAFENYIEPGVQHSGELMQIALKAMQTHPEDRYQKVEDFQEAIRQYRITGRAEELLTEAKNVGKSRYDEYQQSLALFANAIKQWKGNQRAIQGNVQAREAFADLALKRGDYDLGLEVVAGASSPKLEQLQKDLKRNRTQRKVIRTTWVLFGGAAAILLAMTLIAKWDLNSLQAQAKETEAKADEARKRADTADREATRKIAEAEDKAQRLIDDAIKQKTEAEDLAQKEREKADQETKRAEMANKQASEAESKAKAEQNNAIIAQNAASAQKVTQLMRKNRLKKAKNSPLNNRFKSSSTVLNRSTNSGSGTSCRKKRQKLSQTNL